MGWVYLMVAGVLEVAFTTAIRYTDGFTRPLPIVLMLSLAALSFACVAKSTASIPLGTAYAVWGGLGVIGTAGVGIVFYDEPVALVRMVCLALLVASIAGLKLSAA
jgi:quaternary ammonium compound-resistance protein SugE